MKCSVIGNGLLGLSVAVQLCEKGCNVTYIDLSKDRQVLKRYGKDGIVPVIDGKSYAISIAISESFDSVEDCDILVIGTTSSVYPELFEAIYRLIRGNTHVLFMPACYGALMLKRQLSDIGVKATISEATSYPYVCAMSEQGLVVQSKKKTLGLAVCPSSEADQEIKFYNQYFEIFTPVQNLLYTSLDNMNLTLHPLPVLLNLYATGSCNGSFKHYIDGYIPEVGALVEKIDQERLKIGEAFGLTLTSSLQQLKNYYGDSEANDIRSYVINPKGPYTKVGCFGPMSRYVDEDVPGLLVPALLLGRIAGIKTPVLEMCVALAGLINNKDYISSGISLNRLGLEDLDVSEIIKKVESC